MSGIDVMMITELIDVYRQFLFGNAQISGVYYLSAWAELFSKKRKYEKD